MKYEIERDGNTRIFEIRRTDENYEIQIDDGPEIVVGLEELHGIYNLLVDGKSFDAGCLDHDDGVEVEETTDPQHLSIRDG